MANNNPLKDVAVIASVSISRWTGRKLDREVTDEVNERYGAEMDAGRYNKQLIAKKAFADINKITREARTLHKIMTQPWVGDKRLLANKLIEKFTKRMGELRLGFEDAADEFDTKYTTFMENSRTSRLKKMFKAEDYPDPRIVRKKFSFHCAIDSITDNEDLRPSALQELSDDWLKAAERDFKAGLEDAMRDPVERIIAVATKMSNRLKEYKPAVNGSMAENTFRDSLVNNIRDLADMLPAFNLTGDKKLEALIDRVSRDLCEIDADILRENDGTRAKVAKAADDILKQAHALMA
jgi:hypothetical protein